MLFAHPRAALLRTSGLLLALSLPQALTSPFVSAQSTEPPVVERGESDRSIATIEQLQQQVDEQSRILRELRDRLDGSDANLGLISDSSDVSCTPAMKQRVA